MGERKHFDFMRLMCATKASLPEHWVFSGWRRVNFGTPHEALEITGAVVTETFKRGPRKGRLNWAKRDKSTEWSFRFTDAERAAFYAAWEAETGLCHACHGNGEEFYGWSRDEGNKYRPCNRCGATGEAPHAA